MTPLATAVSVLTLYGICAALAALAAKWLGRPIPRATLWIFLVLPLFFLRSGVFENEAPIGPDQAFLTVPESRGGFRGSAWMNDVARQIAPWEEAVRSAWKSGELPNRDRWNGCGTPLDGNGQAAAYSPITLLGLLLPTFAGFTFWAALRLFLCLCGTWLWLTELSISPRAALFGAVAFSFSMTMTAWIFFPLTASVCLWPWVLFLLERLAQAGTRRRAFAALTAVLLLWPLSGHLESVASAAAFTALWLGVRAGLGECQRVGQIFLPAAGAALLALGLSAFSLLPQALAIQGSNRMALMAQPFWTPILSLRPHGPAWTRGPLLVLLPRLLGDKIDSPMIPGGSGAFPEMVLGYFGILPAACLLLFARPGSRRPAAARALLVPICLGLGAAIGLWPFAEIVSALPALRHMLPLRYLSWFALGGAALAAFELDRLHRDLGRRLQWLWPLAALSGVLLFAFGTYRQMRGVYIAAGSLTAEQEAFRTAGQALIAGIAIFAATAATGPDRFRALGLPLLTLVAGAELYGQGARLYAWDDSRKLFAVTPLVEFLRAQPAPFRVAGEGAMLFPNVNVFARLEDVRTHDPAERRAYVEFLDATCGYPPDAYFKQLRDVNAPALDFLNVRYLVSVPGRLAPSEKWRPVYAGPDGTVFENARVLARVFAPERLRVVARGAEIPDRDLFGGLQWSREAAIREEERGALTLESGAANGPALLGDYVERAGSVSFHCRAAGTGSTVLVASLFQDGGWRARDELGRALPTGRANGPFLALEVPPGDHGIRLEYSPPGFRAGSAVSAVSALIAAGLLAAAVRRRSTGR